MFWKSHRALSLFLVRPVRLVLPVETVKLVPRVTREILASEGNRACRVRMAQPGQLAKTASPVRRATPVHRVRKVISAPLDPRAIPANAVCPDWMARMVSKVQRDRMVPTGQSAR